MVLIHQFQFYQRKQFTDHNSMREWMVIIIFMKILSFIILLMMCAQMTSPWCLKTTVNYTTEVTKIDVSPDGTLLAATSASANQVSIFDTTNFLLQFSYTKSGIKTARFTKNGNYLVIGLTNGTIIFIPGRAPFSSTTSFTFNTAGNNQIIDLDVNSGSTQLLICFSNDSNIVVATGIPSNNPTFTSQSIGNDTKGCKWSLNNDAIIIDDYRYAYVYPVTPAGLFNSLVTKINSNSQSYTDIAVRPTTNIPIKVILSGGKSSQIAGCWLTNTGSNTTTATSFTTAPASAVTSACYSPDNSNYAFGSSDGKMWVFNQSTDAGNAYLTDSGNSYLNCAFTPNGQMLLGGTDLFQSVAYIMVYTKTCFFCNPGSYQTGLSSCATCISVMEGCAMCSNSTICTACFQGYYLNNTSDSCYTCISALAGCSTCNTSSVCLECDVGYYLSSGTCKSCLPTYTGCLACNTTSCILCDLDYYLSGTTCIRCSLNGCLRCTGAGTCIQCVDYMFVSGTTCSLCTVPCLTCSVAGANCTTCVRNYWLNGNICTACPTNCLQCINSTSCLECNMGYYITTTGCSLCTSPCATCTTSATTCSSCVLGYFLSTSTCTICTNNCALCNSTAYCMACSVGYYLTAANTCLSCASQYTGCTQCALGACYACDQTRYLFSATSCAICNNTVSNCQTCSATSNCTFCAVGYYLASPTTCTICPAQCDTCTAPSSCTSCTIGYWLSTNTCTLCTSPCATCTSASACLSCIPNYYISGTSCLSCTSISNCLDCTSNITCISCLIGFYANSGTCTACITNCLQCNSTTCLYCNIGYYLFNATTCSACAPTCAACTSLLSCNSCDVGYYLTGTTCTSCTVIGSACLTCNTTVCLSCTSGYYLTASKACQSCHSSVTYCSLCTSSITCTNCMDGFYLANSTSCLSCGSVTGCLACTAANACTLCASGYFLDTGACTACSSNCSSCTSATVCSACAPSFYLSVSSCLACQDTLLGCQTCSNSSICQSCGGGYLLVSSACQPCGQTLPACSLCSKAGVCTTCMQGYFLNSTNYCQVCSSSASLEGCLLCNSSSVCQYCTSGYYLDTNTCHLCSPAMPGCSQCSSPTVCLDCATGYYLSGANQCLLCQTSLQGCIFCSSNTTCLQCQGGYYLSGGDCSPCSNPGCEICNASTPTNCITCTGGYYMNGLTCDACPQTGCLDCNSTDCALCQSGYYLSGGDCLICSAARTGCSLCQSSSLCTQCEQLFYLFGGACYSCSSSMVGCSFCSSSTICLSCDGGYYLSGNTCLPCSQISGCLICSNSSTCLTCTAGYYLSNGTCLECSVAISNCYQCYTNASCASCANGYQVTAAGGCSAMKISSGSAPPPTPPPELQFKSYYISPTVLKHVLFVKGGSTFTKVNTVNWTAVAKITIENRGQSIVLNISSVSASSDATAIHFFTNNPLTVKPIAIPFATGSVSSPTMIQRLLVGQSMENIELTSAFTLPQSALNTVLPSLITTGDLSLSYDLDSGTFYTSYVLENFQLTYYIYGVVIVSLLFLYGFGRSTCLPLMGRNVQITGHILALKTMPLVVFPTFAEYVNFSLGFMSVDLPWLNKLLPDAFFNTHDSMPAGYLFYFTNMNLASLHLFTCLLIILLFAGSYCLMVDPKENQIRLQNKDNTIPNYKFKSFKEFLLNFFSFGLAFAGFSSIIGAFLNYSSILTLNGGFYILGAIAFGVVLSEACTSFCSQKKINRLRVVLKASFLAGAGLNPLYLAATAILVDAILIIVEYNMRKRTLACPIVWLVSNCVALLSLAAYFFIPDSLLTLYLVMIFVGLVVLMEFYMFYCEKNVQLKDQPKVYQAFNILSTENHFWNLQPDKIEEKHSPNHQSKFLNDKQISNANFIGEVEDFVAKDALTTGYSSKGLEPKRRTRRFKREGTDFKPMEINENTSGMWNSHLPTKDLDEIIEQNH